MDWDLDGRLDVFVKNRTGPQLRFLHNRIRDRGTFVGLRLEGRTSNRDAIGAVVELTAGGRRRVGQVTAGSGYLAQSSSTVHFGLGDATTIETLRIRWPGGQVESIDPPAPGAYYRVIEGSGRAQAWDVRSFVPESIRGHVLAMPPPPTTMLKTPLPLPPSLLKAFGVRRDGDRATLVNLWAHWCEPCAEEIRSYATSIAKLENVSIDWRPISLDRLEDRGAASEWLAAQLGLAGIEDSPSPVFLEEDALRGLEVVIEHVTGRTRELPIPTSLLIDARGNLQLLYLGPVFPDRFLSDAGRVLDPSLKAARRSLYPGRWYYRSPRNYEGLSRLFLDLGQLEAAGFYAALAMSD